MRPDFGRFRHQCQSAANSNRAGRKNVRDNVLVLSQAAAVDLIRGRLPVQHAREIGVAVIDAPGSNAETTRSAWSRPIRWSNLAISYVLKPPSRYAFVGSAYEAATAKAAATGLTE